MRALWMVLITLTLAACNSGEASRKRQPPAAGSEQAYGDRVAALPDPQRRAVFLRAIRDAGLDCQHVRSAEEAGRYRDLPVWRATCQGGSVWTNGTAQILNANEARLITAESSNALQQPAR